VDKLVIGDIELNIPQLHRGNHRPYDDRKCAMEMISFLAGEQHTDHPQCVCPIIGSYVRIGNDSMDEKNRKLLIPMLWDMMGTNDKTLVEQRIDMIFTTVMTDIIPTKIDNDFYSGPKQFEYAQHLRSFSSIKDIKITEKDLFKENHMIRMAMIVLNSFEQLMVCRFNDHVFKFTDEFNFNNDEDIAKYMKLLKNMINLSSTKKKVTISKRAREELMV